MGELSDVSCRVFEFFEWAAQRLDVDPYVFLEGTGLTMEYVQNPRHRAPWEAFATMYERLEDLAGGLDEVRILGREQMDFEFLGGLRAIGSGLTSPHALYRISARWAGPSLFRCFRFELEELEDGRLRFVIDIPGDRPGSLAALAAVQGGLEVLPRVLDLPEAEVEAVLESHHAEYLVRPPAAASLLTRLRRALRSLLSLEAAAVELASAQREVAEAHEAMVRSERDFRAALERLPDGVVVCLPTGRMLWANAAWRAWFGEVEPLEDIAGLVVQADRERFAEYLQGQAAPGPLGMLGVAGVRRAEFGPPVEVAFQGRDARLLACRDITERFEAERGRRRAEETNRALLRALPDHVLRLEADGTIGAVFGATNFRVPVFGTEVEGRHAEEAMAGRDILGPEATRRAAEATLHARETGEVQRLEYVASGAGQEAVHELHIVPLEGGATLFVTRDITDRRRLERQVALADRMASVGTLAAGVAHEVNNPLTWVLDRLDRLATRLASGNADAGELASAVGEARDGAERVRRIVRDLSTFARDDEEVVGTIDVREVLQAAARVASSQIRYRARVEWDLQPVPPVLAGESRLGQVFLNLLINAAQAIPEGHADENLIRLGTHRGPEGTVVIEVADSGEGIPPAIRHRIFEPFFTTKEPGVGSGVGLAICHGIVEQLGGSIEVESRVGEGTLFRVVLPMAAGEAEAPAPVPRVEEAVPSRRVLVVDDEPLVADVLAGMLFDHEVTVAHSGEEALHALGDDGSFDAIFCDLMMPGMTGMDLFARLEDEVASRVVFMTGGTFTDRARTFLGQVPNATLQKPFRRADVLQALAGLPRTA